MSTLTQIEDVLTSAVLYQWEAKPKGTHLDSSWSRRTGTYTVIGQDYGVNPFGSFAAPITPKRLQWVFRVVVPATPSPASALDTAAAAVNRGMGRMRQHRLVRSFAGKEQVCIGQVVELQDTTTAAENFRHRDFTVTWELLGPWRDRVSRGPHRVGDTLGVLMGVTPLIMGFGNFAITAAGGLNFNVYADGSDGLPSPTMDDTSPILTVTGPFGSDQGFRIANTTPGASVADSNGSASFSYLDLILPLTSSQDVIVIDCGALSIVNSGNGIDLWPYLVVPDWQPYWQIVVAGVVNTFSILPLSSANQRVPTTKTSISVAWNGLYH